MPNRVLREGILSSDRVDQLDAAAEVFYRRLMSKVDDHGLYDARSAMLRSSLYPLRVDRVREADISRWIAACEKAGLIALYTHEGKPYLRMLDTRWQVRSEPKFPMPPEGGCADPPPPASSCLQPPAVAPVFVVGDGDGKNPPHPPTGGAFDRWWSEWPNTPNKVAQDQCRSRWGRMSLDGEIETILAAVARAKDSQAWKDGLIPAPLTWLRQSRWLAPVTADECKPWTESRSGIEAMGAKLGIGAWDRDAWEKGRGGIDWATYSARVFKAAGIPPRAA